MKYVQALWPTEPVQQAVVAVAAGPSGRLWTASKDGTILQWKVSDDGGSVTPQLLLVGHRAPLKSLVHCFDEKGECLLVSVDDEGQFCSWSTTSGDCIATGSHPELGEAIGSISRHLGGSHVCFGLDYARNEMESSTGSPRRLHGLVALDGVSLGLREVWHPDVSVELIQGSSTELRRAPDQSVLLDFVAFPNNTSSYHEVKGILGVSSTGMLLYWTFTADKPKSQETTGKMATQLQLPLVSASIANDGSHVLLVSQANKCLLQTGKTFPPTKLQEFMDDGSTLNSSNTKTPCAGGMILGGTNDSEGCSFLLWDMSGEIRLICAQNGYWSSASTILASNELNSNAPTEIAFISLLALSSTTFCGVWSTWSEELMSECSKDATVSCIDSAINTFRLDENLPKRILTRTLSSVWCPELSKGIGAGDNKDCVDVEAHWTAGESMGGHLTCCTVVGGSVSCPYTLVQGFSSGKIVFVSLAAYAIPGAPEKSHAPDVSTVKHSHMGHRGLVDCFVEIVRETAAEAYNHDSGLIDSASISKTSATGMLVSGGQDGSLMFWSLQRGQVGKFLFSVHPHTGCVQQVHLPPLGSGAPWCDCVASTGYDGTVALVSLETCQIERILSAHPFKQFESICWDGQRGFLACFGYANENIPNLVIWDLYTAQRERCITGDDAKPTYEHFQSRTEAVTSMVCSAGSESMQYDKGVARVLGVGLDQKTLKLVSSPKQDISFLEIDMEGLLPVQSQALSPPAQSTHAAALACALSVLHVWGIHAETDTLVVDMLRSLELTCMSHESPPNDPSSQIKPTSGISLAQGLTKSHVGPVAIQLPYDVSLPLSGPGRNCGEGSVAHKGSLWVDCPEFVARTLVCLVAISKKLMHDGPSEATCSTCTKLVKFYAMDFLEIVPDACNPSLEALVDLWEDRNPFLKEASRVLIASMTNPEELTRGSHNQVNKTRSLGFVEMTEIIRIWENTVPSQSEAPEDQESLILIAGAICCVHSQLVPERLLNATAPLLAKLATSSGPLSKRIAISAAMLADALGAADGSQWLPKIGDVHSFLNRLFDSCDRYFAPLNPSTPLEWNQKALSSDELDPVYSTTPVDETGIVYGLLNGVLSKTPSSSAGRGSRSLAALKLLKSSREHFTKRFTQAKGGTKQSFLIAEETTHDVDVGPNMPETVYYKTGLVDMLSAVLNLDLQLFWHSLGSRLSNAHHSKPYCSLASISALTRLLHQRDGPGRLAAHLPLIVSVLMHSLDPAYATTRAISQQAVHAALSELASVFPMVDSERMQDYVAVGCPLGQYSRTGESEPPEVVAIYDIKTGAKKKSLSLGKVVQKTGGRFRDPANQSLGHSSGLGIGCLSIRRDGDMIAAFCPGAEVLCVWDLRSGWQHRLIKGPLSIEPFKVIQIQVARPADPSTSLPLFPHKISWQLSNTVAVWESNVLLAAVDLHLGG